MCHSRVTDFYRKLDSAEAALNSVEQQRQQVADAKKEALSQSNDKFYTLAKPIRRIKPERRNMIQTMRQF